MSTTSIPKSTFAFLKDLAANNHRPWFNEHKDRYTHAHEHMIAFAESLISEMSKHDNLEPMTGKKSLHRIYRDTRFSKDKTPYKKHFGGGLKRATKWLRGGYYYHIEPGNTIIAGGFWGPNSADLKRIREEIAADPDSLRKILASKKFKDTFGELHGEKVKTAPKGYSKDHPAIDLLRYKQFLVYRNFSDKEALSADFLKQAVQTFRNMRPFFDYMSEVLTTDANGIPIE
ncbi:MAG: DUF2461 domain-containing protein [Bacteroidota bacterium]